MKKLYKKLFIIASVLLSQQVSAATITWNVPDYSAGLNDVFTLDVIGTGFVGNVDGGGVNISYDATVLNVLSVSIDENIWDLGAGISTGTIDNSVGTVNGITVNAFSSVTGDFIVASIEFLAVGAGLTDTALSEYILNPWGSGGNPINPDHVPGLVTVSAVPLPAAVWLFGAGLAALLGIARRKA